MELGLKYKAATDVGMSRSVNQDSYAFITEGKRATFIVADGMGGVRGGGTASSITIHSLLKAIADRYESNQPLDGKFVEKSIISANKSILATGEKEDSLSGMGTTLCFLSFDENGIILAHVGDSRIYLLQEDGLEQLTRDHTLIQQLVESGKVAAEEAENHPVSHLLTRALGQEDEYEPEFTEFKKELKPGDRFLICSDGLHGHLNSNEIASILKHGSPEEAAENLIEAANDAGGSDNITTIVVEYNPEDSMLSDERVFEFSSDDGLQYVESIADTSSIGSVRVVESEDEEEKRSEDSSSEDKKEESTPEEDSDAEEAEESKEPELAEETDSSSADEEQKQDEEVRESQVRAVIKETTVNETEQIVTSSSGSFVKSLLKSFLFALPVFIILIAVLKALKPATEPPIVIEPVKEEILLAEEKELVELHQSAINFKPFDVTESISDSTLAEIFPLGESIVPRASWFLEEDDTWKSVFPSNEEEEDMSSNQTVNIAFTKRLVVTRLYTLIGALENYRMLLSEPSEEAREMSRQVLIDNLGEIIRVHEAQAKNFSRERRDAQDFLDTINKLLIEFKSNEVEKFQAIALEVGEFEPEIERLRNRHSELNTHSLELLVKYTETNDKEVYRDWLNAKNDVANVRKTLIDKLDEVLTETEKSQREKLINLALQSWSSKESATLANQLRQKIQDYKFSTPQANREYEASIELELKEKFNSYLKLESELPLKKELKFHKFKLAKEYSIPLAGLSE